MCQQISRDLQIYDGCKCGRILYTRSWAETYAEENHISFIALFTGDYDIDMGQTDFTYTKESSEGAVIKCSGEYADFLSVSVDGKPIDVKDYTVEKGSTIIIFTQDFMETLEEGEHTFRLEYEGNKEVEVFMTVKAGGIVGDVDRDGLITSDDALEILYDVAGIAAIDEDVKKLADVDADGLITSDDALVVLEMVAGIR